MSDRATVSAAVLWLTLLGLTIALSATAAANDTLPGDTRILSWVQDRAFPGQTLADAIRSVTSTVIVLGAGGGLAAILWLRGFRRQAVILALGLVVMAMLQFAVKEIADRPRPGADVAQIRASSGSPSFPSGHVMSPTFLYGYLVYVGLAFRLPAAARAALVTVCVTIIALVGPTNVWLGIHWPSDVLGGYAWAAILLAPTVFACRRLGRRP